MGGLPNRDTGRLHSSASGVPALPGAGARRARDLTRSHSPGGPCGRPVGPALGHRASAGASLTTSGRMSIRQPVSLAARRAFCPSLPIASESW